MSVRERQIGKRHHTHTHTCICPSQAKLGGMVRVTHASRRRRARNTYHFARALLVLITVAGTSAVPKRAVHSVGAVPAQGILRRALERGQQ